MILMKKWSNFFYSFRINVLKYYLFKNYIFYPLYSILAPNLNCIMVKLEFFPESNSPIKPNRSYKQRYLAKDPLLVANFVDFILFNFQNVLLMEKQNFGAIQVVEPISLADLLVDKL
jgi:hypothetical protein